MGTTWACPRLSGCCHMWVEMCSCDFIVNSWRSWMELFSNCLFICVCQFFRFSHIPVSGGNTAVHYHYKTQRNAVVGSAGSLVCCPGNCSVRNSRFNWSASASQTYAAARDFNRLCFSHSLSRFADILSAFRDHRFGFASQCLNFLICAVSSLRV